MAGYRRAQNAQTIVFAAVAVDLQLPALGTSALGLAACGTAKKVTVQGGRASLGLGGQLTAIRQAPQIGRVTLGLAGTGEQGSLVVSGSYTHVTITHDFSLGDTAAPTGVVYFTPSAWLKNNGVMLVAAPCPAVLDVEGEISISLAANTDPDTTPTDSYYTVREVIIGQPERSYTKVIPYNAGLVLDLAALLAP